MKQLAQRLHLHLASQSERALRWLMRAYPADLRGTYVRVLVDEFAIQCRRASLYGLAWIWVSTLFGLTVIVPLRNRSIPSLPWVLLRAAALWLLTALRAFAQVLQRATVRVLRATRAVIQGPLGLVTVGVAVLGLHVIPLQTPTAMAPAPGLVAAPTSPAPPAAPSPGPPQRQPAMSAGVRSRAEVGRSPIEPQLFYGMSLSRREQLSWRAELNSLSAEGAPVLQWNAPLVPPTATPTSTPTATPTGPAPTVPPQSTPAPPSQTPQAPGSTAAPVSTPLTEPMHIPTGAPAPQPAGTALPPAPPMPSASPTATLAAPTPSATPTGEPSPFPSATPTGEPTATTTPEPSDRPTATPTATPCTPQTLPLDVLLVIDRSGSMRGQAWVDTQQAATHFVSLLGPDDQAGLVSFAAQVNVDMQLTYNHTAVASAIARLGLGSGTNIAAGVSAATQALRDTHRPGGAVAAMIVLTDGVTKGGEDAARAAATAAKQAGVRVLTIGLGSEVNATLLTEMASAPHDYHPAPSSSDLDKIYRSIAETLPCERSN